MDSPNVCAQSRAAWRVGLPIRQPLGRLHRAALVSAAGGGILAVAEPLLVDILARRADPVGPGCHRRTDSAPPDPPLPAPLAVGRIVHCPGMAPVVGSHVWHGDTAARAHDDE